MKRFKTYLVFPLSAVMILALGACGEQRDRAARDQQTGEAAREGDPYTAPAPGTTPGTAPGTMDYPGGATGQAGTADRANALTGQDRNFLTEAMHGNMAEIEMARMVEARGSRQEVKDYARQLREDHEQARQRLQNMAQQYQVTVPMQMPDRMRNDLERMRGLSGDQLDREFLNVAVQSHQRHIQQYEQVANQSQHSDMKQFASDQLPKLQQHLQRAQDLQGQSGNRTGAMEQRRNR